MKKRIPVAIIVRVSTARQETARQEHELKAAAGVRGWRVVEVIRERISGRAPAEERSGLRRAMELAEAGAIKKVLVHEVSRLGRRPSVIHGFLEHIEGLGVSLYWHSQGIETLLPSGKRNPSAAIMLAVLAELGRAEVEQLSARTKSGLAAARRRGVVLGRPKGSGEGRDVRLKKHRDILRLLKAGQSLRHAAKLTGKGLATVCRVKAQFSDILKRPKMSH